MKEIQEMLKGLKLKGAIGSAAISRDGTIIAADIPKGTNIETFAIMMATIIGATVTAAAELNRSPPRTIIAESEDTKILIKSARKKVFLTIILPKDEDEKEFLNRAEEILLDVKEIDT